MSSTVPAHHMTSTHSPSCCKATLCSLCISTALCFLATSSRLNLGAAGPMISTLLAKQGGAWLTRALRCWLGRRRGTLGCLGWRGLPFLGSWALKAGMLLNQTPRAGKHKMQTFALSFFPFPAFSSLTSGRGGSGG